MGALQFSAFDLHANQAGQLSPAQRSYLEGLRLQQAVLWMTIVVIAWAVGLLADVSLVLLVLGTGAVWLTLSDGWRHTTADLNGEVQSVSGSLMMRQGSFPFFGVQLTISGEVFGVSPSVGAAFISGCTYRLYFTPESRAILSAELLS